MQSTDHENTKDAAKFSEMSGQVLTDSGCAEGTSGSIIATKDC